MELAAIRRQLHRIAEVSGAEHQTAAFVADFLRPLQPAVLLTGLGGTGVCATFDSGQAGPHLLFRAELDALPIQEINSFSYTSLSPGVSHKCGHDGHMTILLGLALSLSEKPIRRGRVSLLFQPAEETGEGAAAVLADPAFEAIQPDRVYALHNVPAYPLGELLVRTGSITAAVKSMVIAFSGKTAHAAEPEHGKNPAGVLARILLALDELSQQDTDRSDFQLITPVHAVLGEKAYGVAAGHAALHLTLRAWTNDQMEVVIAALEKRISEICGESDIGYAVSWTNVFEANTNDAELAKELSLLAATAGIPVKLLSQPFKWGEDFGYFTQRYRGLFLGLGSGEACPALHNPDYDFPDALLDKGVSLFRLLVEATLA